MSFRVEGKQTGEMFRRRESEAGGGSLEAQGGGGGRGGVAWKEHGVQMGGPLIHGG